MGILLFIFTQSSGLPELHTHKVACFCRYCEALRMNGLTSTVEPASSGKGTDEPAA